MSWWEPPTKEDGSVDVVQVARDISAHVNQVGGYLISTGQICAEMALEMPPRGVLIDRFDELLDALAFVEQKWRYADDALMTAARLVEFEHDDDEEVPW